jgi:hypothetical protein
MASDQILVNVSFREIPLYDGAVLRDVDGSGGFLRSDSPMPVGTLLMLSPARNLELKVPARVQLVVEACRGAKTPGGELPGMNVTFEAAGEYLLDYREEAPAEPDRPEVSTEKVSTEKVSSKRKLDPDSVPTVVIRQMVVEMPPEERPSLAAGVVGGTLVVGPSALRGPEKVAAEPSVIIDAPAESSHGADTLEPEIEAAEPPGAEEAEDTDARAPDAPDKVVVEMIAEPEPMSLVAAAEEEEDEGEGADEEGGEGGEEDESGEDGGGDKRRKRARNRKARRRKKK